jgi:hypothetical protein
MQTYFRNDKLTKEDTSKYVSAKGITFRVAYTAELQSAVVPIQAEIFSESGFLIPLEDISYALTTWEHYKQYMAFRKNVKASVDNRKYVDNIYGTRFYFEPSANIGVKSAQYNTALAWCIASVLAQLFWDICISIKKELQKQKLWMTKVFATNLVHDDFQWLVAKDLYLDNYFPEMVKYFITDHCKLPTGTTLGLEMVATSCWKGKDKLFSGETKWNFETQDWDWKK